MRTVPGKRLILWCQRQEAVIMAKTHPLHGYTFAIPCASEFERAMCTHTFPGEFFVVHLGDGGNYRLINMQVAEAAKELGLSLKDVEDYYHNNCRDAFGKQTGGR
jgi:aromatic ring-opening dioxygenase catalytic subunit (LigB family)